MIGGLISSQSHGTFFHSNTIEEYNSIDLNEVMHEESKQICNTEDMTNFNRFVVVTFGDLKNYIYIHRYSLIKLLTYTIGLLLLNLKETFLSKSQTKPQAL